MAAAMNFGKLFLGAIVIKYYNNNNETDEAVKLLKRLKYFFKYPVNYISFVSLGPAGFLEYFLQII